MEVNWMQNKRKIWLDNLCSKQVVNTKAKYYYFSVLSKYVLKYSKHMSRGMVTIYQSLGVSPGMFVIHICITACLRIRDQYPNLLDSPWSHGIITRSQRFLSKGRLSHIHEVFKDLLLSAYCREISPRLKEH